MPKHIKPTKEELEANIKKSQEDIAALENKPSPSPSQPVTSASPSVSISPSPSPSEPVPSPSPSLAAPPDYKKKFAESSREALVLHSKTKKMSEAVDQAGQIPEPTDEEMLKEFPDWELMSDLERKIAKDNRVNNKRFEIIQKASQEGKILTDWIDKVDKFAEDPNLLVNVPELEGKIEEFKVFATKPTRRGVDFNDLVAAFLYEVGKEGKPKNKGKMFETGTGGPNEKLKPKDNKISIEEARTLRKTDYGKWKEYLKAGRIRGIEET